MMEEVNLVFSFLLFFQARPDPQAAENNCITVRPLLEKSHANWCTARTL